MARATTSVLLLGLLAALTGGAARAREVAFQTVLQTSATAGWGATAGDLDGDGDLDLALTDDSDDTVRWLDLDGGLGTVHSIATAVDGAAGVALGDFDGDGTLDVAAAGRDAGDVLVWSNDGDGITWSGPDTVAASALGVTDLVAGDLDGDGDPDLVGAVTGADIIRRWLNGGGGVWTASPVSTVATGVADLELADVDGDGDLDVVAAVTGADKVGWWANDGAGGGWASTQIAPAIVEPLAIAVADLDADGDLDVAGAIGGSEQVVWWESTAGDGSAWSAAQPLGDLEAVLAVGIADLDGDGDADVAATSASYTASAGWFEQTAPDTWLWRVLDTAHHESRQLLLTDLFDDGDVDLVYPSAATGSGVWSMESRDHRRRPRFRAEAAHDSGINRATIKDWAVGDIDGDGRADAVLNDHYVFPDLDRILVARGGGGNPDILAYSWDFIGFADGRVDFLDLGDVDGDGDLDILAGSTGPGHFVDIWENAGTMSNWTAHLAISDSGEPPFREIATGDLDGDGDLDIAGFLESLSPAVERVLGWWEQVGDPFTLTGWVRHDIDTASDASLLVTEIRVGDVDADGRLDLVTAWDSQTGPINVWKNLGGTPPVFARLDLPEPGTRQLELADFDRDGDLDVGGEDAWWENDPYAIGAWVRHPVEGMAALSAFDLDRDGDHDLVGGSCDDGTGVLVSPCWWRNEVRDTVADFFGTPLPPLSDAAWLLAADFDGDADGDILGGPTAGFTATYRNQGGQAALAAVDEADFALEAGALGTLLALDLTFGGTAGDPPIELATLALDLTADGLPVDTATLSSLVAALELWRDDGDGVRNAADTMVVRETSLTAAAGRVALALPDGNLSLQVSWNNPDTATPARLWLDVELAAGAAGTGITTLAVDFDPANGSVVEGSVYDTPLLVERESPRHRELSILAAGPLFSDGFESGDTTAWSAVVVAASGLRATSDAQLAGYARRQSGDRGCT